MLLGTILLAATMLENALMQIQFADADRGYGVTSIVSRAQANDAHFLADTGEVDFWRLSFVDSAAQRPYESLIDITSRNHAKRYVTHNGDITDFHFDGIAIGSEPNALDVVATVELRDDGFSYWSLKLTNRSRRYALYETKYPILKRILPEEKGDALLPSSNLGARLCRNFVASRDIRKVDRSCYLGYRPMVTGWFLGSAGLYVAAHDREGHIKCIEVNDRGDLLFATTVANAGVVGKAANSPEYPVVIGCVNGDWWQIAKTYRKFAMTCPWTAKGPIAKRRDYPHALAETDLWFTLYGSAKYNSASALKILESAKRHFSEVRSGLHWHCWNLSGHDTNYPEYFPHVKGTTNAVAALKALDQLPALYINGRLWDASTMGWRFAQRSACMQAKGSRHIEKYDNGRCQGVMCPAEADWQNVLIRLTERITGSEMGSPAIFIDQIGAAKPCLCFDPTHHHTLGGGTYWYDGYRQMLERLHSITEANGAALTTEGTCEAWIDSVDGYLIVTIRKENDVPFYPAVYSGYTTYFCSNQKVLVGDALSEYVQTRETLAGIVNGWYGQSSVEDAKFTARRDSLAKLVSLRHQYHDYLAYGSLLDEARFAAPPGISKITGRLVKAKNQATWEVPSVIGYEWLHVDGQRRAIFLANISGAPKSVTLTNSAFAGTSLTLEPHSLRVVTTRSSR